MRSPWEDMAALGMWTAVTAVATRAWQWLRGADEEEEVMSEDTAVDTARRRSSPAVSAPANPRPVRREPPPSASARPDPAPKPVSSPQPAQRAQAPASRPDWDRLAAEAVAVDLVRLLESRGYRPVWRRKDGEKATFHVPWRSDRHPSLGVYRRGSVWYWTDHARGESGTPIHAIQRLDGVDRKEAILRLTGWTPSSRAHVPRAPTSPARPVQDLVETDPDRERRKAEARERYQTARAAMTPARAAAIARYWRERGLNTVPDIGAVWLELEAGGQSRPYVGIPLPSPKHARALECRLLDGVGLRDRLWRARTYGPKELWVHWRDRSVILVTESVLDALSALVLWPERADTLVSLNGVGNVRLLPTLVQQAAKARQPIRLVRLALDADQAGRDATAQAEALLSPLGVQLLDEDAHVQAAVKDLNKLLLNRIGSRLVQEEGAS